jgi:hypothetical protein
MLRNIVVTGLWPVDPRTASRTRNDGPQGRGYNSDSFKMRQEIFVIPQASPTARAMMRWEW